MHELVTHALGHPNLTADRIDLWRVYMHDVDNLASMHDIVHIYTCSSSGKCYNGQAGNIRDKTSHYCTYSECNDQLWRILTVNPKLTCITATGFITTIKLWISKHQNRGYFPDKSENQSARKYSKAYTILYWMLVIISTRDWPATGDSPSRHRYLAGIKQISLPYIAADYNTTKKDAQRNRAVHCSKNSFGNGFFHHWNPA